MFYKILCVYVLVPIEITECDSSDICGKYLATIYRLLSELNDVIRKDMEDFSAQEKTTPTQIKKSERTAPRLSPDVLSVG